jgi:hypothetical protein
LQYCHSFDKLKTASEAQPKNLRRYDLTKSNRRDSSRSLSSSEAKGSE